ncbi:phosphodiester glycosidase family protein [Erythrobacter rubeus]|uniref:Phosphodiester glycosidase family protein n=1 Tax=Erythrobacter rubeus TaxID=2760803 RepID=A0ABR8KQX2_9SPHN|nr:phosphodiester glycosidase family protein [Erythrobacter rubeus]MBD2841730.1 phosphodiester glycosidase family protein [Erythrobacter rubeus]
MKPSLTFILAAMVLSACTEQPEGDPILRAELGEDGAAQEIVPVPEPGFDTLEPEAEPVSACRLTSFEQVSLTHCIADPAEHRITTALAPSSGDDAGRFAGFARDTETDTVEFAMNGGMYGDDLKAIGYFVQDSDRLSELNRADGEGNFHMKPNGVFFGSDGTWRVLDSDTFFRTVGDRPQFGTQSGPMLVVEGELHPDFQENGPSRAIRNGVGVDAAGKAHFVISEEPISFGQFARFFRDRLETPNALYLDGNISSLWNPATGRMDSGRVGPLLVVEKK